MNILQITRSIFKGTLYFTAFFALIHSMAFAETETALAPQCQLLFQETEQLVEQASNQPGSHDQQLKKMKRKLTTSKQQISALSLELQEKSCDKGLAVLTNLKQKY